MSLELLPQFSEVVKSFLLELDFQMSLEVHELQRIGCHLRVEIKWDLNFTSTDGKAFELEVEVQLDDVLQQSRVWVKRYEGSHGLDGRLPFGQLNESHPASHTSTGLFELFHASSWKLLCSQMNLEEHLL